VLFVLPTLDLGGAERQALLLAEYLRSHGGCDVAIAALFGGTGGQALRSICRQWRIPCLRFNMPEFTGDDPPMLTRAGIRHFIRELKFLAPDVLLPYTSLPNILCGLGWKKGGASACIWGQRDAGAVSPDSPWQPAALQNTPHFAANSQAGFDYLVQNCRVSPEQAFLIPNGVRLTPPIRSRSSWRSQLGASDEDIVAGMIANVQPLKDHRTLLLAWREVVRSMPHRPPILCLAGQLTSSAPPLRQLADNLGLADSVRWLGLVEDISGLLSALDLAVFSSAREGLPNGILEPMAAGLAVVATDNAGSRQAFDQPQYPYLAKAADPNDFAAKVIALLGSPETRRTLGKNNHQRVSDAFSIEALGRAYDRLLQNALRQPAAPNLSRGTAFATERLAGRKSVLYSVTFCR
jgi:glycosyltransferase involved in cell wall biosynthesis